MCNLNIEKKESGIEDFFMATTMQNLGPLGIIERNSEGVTLHKHGGQAYSSETLLYKNYNNEITIIIMTNSKKNGELDELKDKILEILGKEHLL